MNTFVIWGGIERAVTSQQFRGGEATALMGGIELDLRRAQLAPGEQQLTLTAVMGGIAIRMWGGRRVARRRLPGRARLRADGRDRREKLKPSPKSTASTNG